MGWSTHHSTGLIHYAPQNSYRGYTLLANVGGHDAKLIDMEGRICHEWRSDEGISYGYLLPNGNLLLRTGPAAEETSFLSRPERNLVPGGGRTTSGAILELDWDSNVVWEYRYPFLHHDFERLPNGNTLITESDRGRAFEVTPEQEIVWEYRNPHRAGPDGRFIATLFEAWRLPTDFPLDWLSARPDAGLGAEPQP